MAGDRERWSGNYTFSWSGVLYGTGEFISGVIGSPGTLYLTVNDGQNNAYAQMPISIDEFMEECIE